MRTDMFISLGPIAINRRVHWPHDASTWKPSSLFYIPFFSLSSPFYTACSLPQLREGIQQSVFQRTVWPKYF